VPTNMRMSKTTRTQIEELAPRTEIHDLSRLGPELDERQLTVVAGGIDETASIDGGSTGGSCGGCH
jgi:hypothetical protein